MYDPLDLKQAIGHLREALAAELTSSVRPPPPTVSVCPLGLMTVEVICGVVALVATVSPWIE